jgi:hypothetical protein
MFFKNKILTNVYMSSLDINRLYDTIHEKNNKRLQSFDKVLQKVHSRILYQAKLEKTYCFYQIPEFIIGMPLYNVKDLKKYIMNSLQKNGFELLCIDPNWLFISWEPKQIKKRPKKKQKKNDFKQTEEYKPTGGFMYNAFDLSSLKDASNQLLQ